MEASPRYEWASFPIESLIVDTQLGSTVLAKGFGIGRMSEMGIEQGTSAQDFLEGKNSNYDRLREAFALPLLETCS